MPQPHNHLLSSGSCRKALTEDVAWMVPIYADSFPSALSMEALAAWCGDPAVVAGVVVHKNAQVAGMVMARVVMDEADILTLAVAPDCRGLGYGRALMNWLLNELAGRAVAQVWLEVRASATPAQELYKSLGFQGAGVRPGYYATAHPDQREDAVLMRLGLATDSCQSLP
jgi:ribosomal-protein-alanine N-acetyltransferase